MALRPPVSLLASIRARRARALVQLAAGALVVAGALAVAAPVVVVAGVAFGCALLRRGATGVRGAARELREARRAEPVVPAAPAVAGVVLAPAVAPESAVPEAPARAGFDVDRSLDLLLGAPARFDLAPGVPGEGIVVRPPPPRRGERPGSRRAPASAVPDVFTGKRRREPALGALGSTVSGPASAL